MAIILNKMKSVLKIMGVYLLLAIFFWLIGGEQLKYKYVIDDGPEPIGIMEELSAGMRLEQNITVETETLDSLQFRMGTYGRVNQGNITIKLLDHSTNELITQTQIAAEGFKDREIYRWEITPGIPDTKGKAYNVIIESDGQPGMSPTIYYAQAYDKTNLQVNGEVRNAILCLGYVGKVFFTFGEYYWLYVIIGGILIFLYAVWTWHRESKGKSTIASTLVAVWIRYGFLIRQLVSRDFKTKYKRSVLGYLWSFLNPLLTMSVQYIVFSTIFKSGIDNFPVYLLSGIIMFTFFQEAVGQGLIAIVANASLITKVYMPKYIYPVTKVVSSSINLFISIIPLLLVTVLTGARITKAVLLLPYALLCLLAFCVGLSMLLSTAMVFFRDTQYLWSIISLAWMYATPLFYPADIIPAQFRFIQTLNPLFHFVRFVRTILIDGISPEPKAYLICGVSAILMCVLGSAVFKKYQDKFVLYV